MGHSKSKEAYWTSAIGTDLTCYQARHKIGSVCPNSVKGVSMVNCQVKSCVKRGYTVRGTPGNKPCTLDSGKQSDSCEAWNWGKGGDPPPAVGLPANMQVVGLGNNFGALAGGKVSGPLPPGPRPSVTPYMPHHRTRSAPMQHFQHQAHLHSHPLYHYTSYVASPNAAPVNIVRHTPLPQANNTI
eukprot:TRINITY_DN10386_c0_g1_i1.p1 TRINITY_DN10386_c0_g1~~TRINITY_DN10386_c0_g1_i1.p1  ORF type:complete len:185 (+),score=10.78 TRINITY_DN10386_c0_g1_i1:405-959(+)